MCRQFKQLALLALVLLFSAGCDNSKQLELEKQLSEARARADAAEQQLAQSRVRADTAEQKLAALTAEPAWKTKPAWMRLQQQMSKQEVTNLLGSPPKMVEKDDARGGDGRLAWYYQDYLGGAVWFDAGGRVSGWRIPLQFE